MSASLNAARRERELDQLGSGEVVDVLVVGGGVTGAGIALDAASRGLSVALVEAADLAYGTSRWSSKLVHGGLRYLASGRVGLAYESAAERGILMERTAPHLTRALPQLFPFPADTSWTMAAGGAAGLAAGDLVRAASGTSSATLPPPRAVSRVETLRAVPALRADVRGGLLSWDGQLEDDARLVTALARTAAAHGAKVVTRVAAEQLGGDGGRVRDTLTGAWLDLRARAVVNATGAWADRLVPGIRLRPSRGTHLVLPAGTLGHPRVGVMFPVPGEPRRAVFALPQPGGHLHVGLTDEPVDGPVPDVPQPTEPEITFLLDVVSRMLSSPLDRGDVVGAYAGIRPLLDQGPGRTVDLSRKHAVLTSPEGVISVVGGKLTTYRRMAEHAVDTAVRCGGLLAGPCRTRRLPLVGAAPRPALARVPAPPRLVDRYGTEAPDVLAQAGGDPELLAPIADGVEVTGAELLFALRHEAALDESDLLDRRTRIGLVPALRERALPTAASLLARVG